MPRKQRSVEEIIGKLREAEVALAQGETLGQACRRIGVSDHTFYRWRREYGGLKVDQAKRLRDMEGENARLRRAVADLTVDNQILKEAAGKLLSPGPPKAMRGIGTGVVWHLRTACLPGAFATPGYTEVLCNNSR